MRVQMASYLVRVMRPAACRRLARLRRANSEAVFMGVRVKSWELLAVEVSKAIGIVRVVNGQEGIRIHGSEG